jgi:transcription termination factor Rho
VNNSEVLKEENILEILPNGFSKIKIKTNFNPELARFYVKQSLIYLSRIKGNDNIQSAKQIIKYAMENNAF